MKLTTHHYNPETGKVEQELLDNHPYKDTFTYQSALLGNAIRELGWVILEPIKCVMIALTAFLNAIADWFEPPTYETKLPYREFVKAPDGVILLVQEAPAVQYWRDGVCFDENGVCIGNEDGV